MTALGDVKDIKSHTLGTHLSTMATGPVYVSNIRGLKMSHAQEAFLVVHTLASGKYSTLFFATKGDLSPGSLTPGLLCALDTIVISHLISSQSWLCCVVDCMGGAWQKMQRPV